jgi:hypothetical protein
MNGMADGSIIHKIIDGPMQYMDQKDELVEIKSATDWVFLANDREEPWKDILTRNYSRNLHVMNKRSIDRNYTELLGAIA